MSTEIETKTEETPIEKVPETKTEKTFSEDEFNKALQAESDKRVSGALKTAQEKWETEFLAKLESEKSEAEKLGAMTAEERNKAELDKQRKEFENERTAFLKEKMENQTIKELSAEGLPIEFSQYVLADTAEDVKSNIATFKAQWQSAIEKAVTDKLVGKTPKTATGIATTMSKKEFGLLSPKKRQELYESNPNILDELN